jgi:hypothetical protein
VTEATPLQAMEGNLDYKRFFVMVWNKLYRADITRGVRFPEGRIHEDEFTTHKFYLAAQKIVAVDTAAYNYDRSREGSITARFRAENLTDACAALRERMYLAWETPVLAPLGERLCNLYGWILFDRLVKCEQAGIDLGDLRVRRTVQDALADWPKMRQHGLAERYEDNFKALKKGGAKHYTTVLNAQREKNARKAMRYAPENRGKGLLNRAVRAALRMEARWAATEQVRHKYLALEADVREKGIKTVMAQGRGKDA